MSTNIPQSREDFVHHLQEHIQFLEASCASFDNGFEGEAKRLSATIRVLVHDTTQSKSLLGQLGMKNILFLDTASANVAGNLMPYSGLTMMVIERNGSRYIPRLDDHKNKMVTFDKWWSTVIFVDKNRNTITRKELILSIANKDGGAHIDPVLDEKYGGLSRHNSLGWVATSASGKPSPLLAPEKAAVRQIAYEMLVTLNPNYKVTKPKIEGVIMGDVSFVSGNPTPPVHQVARVGRNELCPCKSGKKYKHCHGR